MTNYQDLISILNILVLVIVIIFAIYIVLKVFKIGFYKNQYKEDFYTKINNSWSLKYKILGYLKLFAGGLSLICLPLFLLFATSIKLYLKPVVTYSTITFVIIVITVSLNGWNYVKKSILVSHKKLVFSYLSSVFSAFLFLFLSFNIPEIFHYPSIKESVLLDLPIKGKWAAAHAGGAEIVNYHHISNQQKFAMDIVKLSDKNKVFKENGGKPEHFYSFGEDVFSPIDGKIIAVVTDLPDKDISFVPDTAERNPAGNHVVIKTKDNLYVFMAHFQNGSIVVEKDAEIKSGDFIGKVGNSGNTSFPHLHLHVQTSSDLYDKEAVGLPFRFNQMNRKRWFRFKNIKNGLLIRNDVFYN